MQQTIRPIQTRFRFAYISRLKLACYTNSLAHYTKGTPSGDKPPPTACKHQVSDLFHSHLWVLFTFPSRYLCTIGRMWVFSLGGWSPHIQTRFHVPRLTRELHSISTRTGLSPTMVKLSRLFRFIKYNYWAVPISLVTTLGISFWFLFL